MKENILDFKRTVFKETEGEHWICLYISQDRIRKLEEPARSNAMTACILLEETRGKKCLPLDTMNAEHHYA